MNEENLNLLPNWLYQHNRENPDGLALIAGGEEICFAELYRRACCLAGQLAGLGIGRGSRVAVLMGNRRQFVEIVQALMQLEAVLVPLNLRLTPPELGWQLADVKADLLLTDQPHLAQSQAAIQQLPTLRQLVVEESGPSLGDLPEAAFPTLEHFDPAALHNIIYSSGTTGQPKGVRLTYGNHFFNATASTQNLPAGPADRWLAVLPLFHVGGLAIVLRGLFYAMPVVVQDGFDPAAVNRALDHEGITLISVVSNMLARMLDQRHDRPYPATFRTALVGGGPVPAPLLERCARAGIPVMQTYGLTETASQSVTLAPADALRKLGSAGKPLPGVELRIERDDKPIEATGPEAVGEIVLRGPNITPGYENRQEATALAWRNGWFHTGDLGWLDEEGFLYVADRRDDLIISGGENIYPAEIEAVLLSHPAIEEAGVVGQPHQRWGQVPVAFVKMRPGFSVAEAEILAYCAERLARYKIPVAVNFSGPLPRNATGKLLRRALRAELK